MPAGSSAGETIFDPEESRASDELSMLLALLRAFALFCAAIFVLMTIFTLFLESPLAGFSLRNIRVAWQNTCGHSPVSPVGCKWPPTASVSRHQCYRLAG